jgi:hypothetical protein
MREAIRRSNRGNATKRKRDSRRKILKSGSQTVGHNLMTSRTSLGLRQGIESLRRSSASSKLGTLRGPLQTQPQPQPERVKLLQMSNPWAIRCQKLPSKHSERED